MKGIFLRFVLCASFASSISSGKTKIDLLIVIFFKRRRHYMYFFYICSLDKVSFTSNKAFCFIVFIIFFIYTFIAHCSQFEI